MLIRMELRQGAKRYQLRQRGLDFDVVDPNDIVRNTGLSRSYANGWCEVTKADLRYWLGQHGFSIISEDA